MRKLLAIVAMLLMLGCATQNINLTPSQFLSCDDFQDSEVACFSPKECEEVMYNVGMVLAQEMSWNSDQEGSVDFRVVRVFERLTLIGTVYTERRSEKSLWMLMDAIVCDDSGNIVDEQHMEREFNIR